MWIKKDENFSYLLLDYIQSLYFESIQEIIFYFTKKYQKLYGIKVYEPNSIDEYNRIITSGSIKSLIKLKQIFEDYGLNTTISEQEDPIFQAKRYEYLLKKFPHKNAIEFLNKIRKTFEDGGKTILQYEPTILEIKENQIDNNCENKIYILYHQNISWNKIQSGLTSVMKKIQEKIWKTKDCWDVNIINKYNRLFFTSKHKKEIDIVLEWLREKNINAIVLSSEDDFMPYRTEYILKNYNKHDASYIQTKWRYEFENNWFNQEPWDPIIFDGVEKK